MSWVSCPKWVPWATESEERAKVARAFRRPEAPRATIEPNGSSVAHGTRVECQRSVLDRGTDSPFDLRSAMVRVTGDSAIRRVRETDA